MLPGDRPERETSLEHGELITAIELRADPLYARSDYLKVRDRASYEFALVSVAVRAAHRRRDASPRRGSRWAASRRCRGAHALPSSC